MGLLSIYPDEEDDEFWADHAYVRLRAFSLKHPEEPEQIILGNTIWFGSVASQDDIFEGRPRFEFDREPPSIESIRELARRRMRNASEKSIQRVVKEIWANVSDPFVYAVRKAALSKRSAELYNQSSILSFFRDTTVQRNWADYAENGTGYALIFDFREPWIFCGASGLEESEWVPFEVKYVSADNTPAIRLHIGPVNRDEAFGDIEAGLLTKSDEWRAQSEERLIRVGVPAGHVVFPPNSLRAVVLGYNIDPDRIRQLVEINARRDPRLPLFRVAPKLGTRRLSLGRVQ